MAPFLCVIQRSPLQRLQEQEHSVQDLVDLNLRVPLEKEIPVTVVPEKKEGAKSADGEEEFPEITEVNLCLVDSQTSVQMCF